MEHEAIGIRNEVAKIKDNVIEELLKTLDPKVIIRKFLN